MVTAVEEMVQPPDNRPGTRTMNMIGQIEPFARSSNIHGPNSWAFEISLGGLNQYRIPQVSEAECDNAVMHLGQR